MERVKRLFQREVTYEPVEGGSEELDGEPSLYSEHDRFSWTDYSVFLLLGVAMLWAW
jgi:equilibrative nucleoside transporter 1/2/3